MLDSDTAIEIMRHPRGATADRFIALSQRDVAISMITKAEIFVGPYRKKSHADEMAKVRDFLTRVRIIPFDDACADEFGKIAAGLFDAGRPIDGMDMEIAATARHWNMILVTGNTGHFQAIPNLMIEDWMGAGK